MTHNEPNTNIKWQTFCQSFVEIMEPGNTVIAGAAQLLSVSTFMASHE